MNRSRFARRAFAVLSAAFTAALTLDGPAFAGGDVTETRHVAGFEGVRLAGAFKSTITAGGATRVTISGDPGLVARVTTEVRDGTLVVGMKSNTNFLHGAPHVEITLPVLRRFANSGAGSTKISGLAGGDLSIENDGAATIEVTGRVARLNVSLNGIGKIDASGLAARDATVDNDGVGRVDVRASGTLTASVNGVGEIRYAGNPAHVERQVNGIGRIEPF